MTPNWSNIPEALAHWADTRPEATAFVYLQDGERESRRMSFAQLHAACAGMAQALLARVQPGDRALLLYPQGLDFVVAFFGCLYAGVVAIPVSAPEARSMRRSLARLGQVVADADPGLILSTRAMANAAAEAIERIPAFAGRDWLATEDIPARDWPGMSLPNDSVAYLQYTSGSTSAPKGVEITHANMAHNVAGLNRIEPPREGDSLVSWLPQFHDFGLIYGTMWPVFNGLPAYIMAPADFVARPARWLEAITRYRATHSGGANFAYDLCARKVDDATLATLDLGSWRLTINGAEPIRSSSLEAFIKKFSAVGFRPQTMRPSYGMAESTLVITSVRPSDTYRTLRVDRAVFEQEHRIAPLPLGDTTTPYAEIVGCGHVVEGHEAAVVNPDTFARCPDDVIGEVWMSGGSIAKGYYNNPVATEETFGARIAREDGPRHLRTGDYGFFHEGQVYITGRRKDLIIIRGANYYPQDIEETAYTSHDAFRPGCASAFSIDTPDGEQLTVVLELKDEAAAGLEHCQLLVRALREAIVREHGIQAAGVALLPPRTLPKTTSGKIQRGPCREALLAGDLPTRYCELPGKSPAADIAQAQPEDMGEWLCHNVAAVLGIAPAHCALETSVLELGLDSLKAMEVVGQIEATYGVRLELGELYDAATPHGIAAQIQAAQLDSTRAPIAVDAAVDYEEGTL